MIELDEGQYEVDGLLMGADTAYVVRSFEDGGLPSRRTGDVAAPYDDGWIPGEDLFDGLACTFDVLVETAAEGSRAAVRAMVKAWRGDAVRRTPGAVQVLRMRAPGGDTLRLYGRTRECTPVKSKNTGVGLVPVVANFLAVDDRWYADVPNVFTVAQSPDRVGGIPTIAGHGLPGPIPTVYRASVQTEAQTGGELEAWPVITINGPVVDPLIECRADGIRLWRVGFQGTLVAGESVTVDARPWVRTMVRENGDSWSPLRSPGSTPLADVVLPAGATVSITYRSADQGTTGAFATIECADAYPTD